MEGRCKMAITSLNSHFAGIQPGTKYGFLSMSRRKPPLTGPAPKASGGHPSRGTRVRQIKSIIEDLAHTGIFTTVRKKGARRETSLKLLIKN
jgi:hypothetical protein